ncbi:MAG: carbohydrate porin [Candidatus Rhabdochlamydia sp.]
MLRIFIFILVWGAHLLADLPDVNYQEDTLTGDWNGTRSYLKDRGVSIDISYVNDLLGNPIGGKRRGFANAGSLGIDLSVDFEKMACIQGLSLFTSFVYRSGNNLSSEYIDNQFPVAQVFGGETYRLNELYVQEAYEDLFSLKAGRLCGGNDFLASPFYAKYVSNAFCGNPIGIFFNVPFTAYPNSTWGAYLSFKPHESFLIKGAIYNANSYISKNKYHGTNFTFHSTQGALLITEWAYLFNQLDCGLPGNYKIGGYYTTGTSPKFIKDTQKGNYGYYFLFDQMLYQKEGKDQGLTYFLALLFAPKDRNRFPFFFSTGLVYQGISENRPLDSISCGIAQGSYSSDLRSIQKKTYSIEGSQFGNHPQTTETVLELNYWFQINKWLALTPDLQYIINPKGYGTIKNALVLGMQVSIEI